MNEQPQATEAVAEGPSLLDEITAQTKRKPSDDDYGTVKRGVEVLLAELLKPKNKVERVDKAMADAMIAEIDAKMSAQLDEIMHNEAFQKLEATWRGLWYLIYNTETSTQLKIRVLPITRKEMQKDLETAIEFDQSNLFKKIYEEEYGTFGGNPYSCLIGDFEFGYMRSQEAHSTSLFGKPEYNLYVEDARYKTIIESMYAAHRYTSPGGRVSLRTSLWRGYFEIHPDSKFINQFLR